MVAFGAISSRPASLSCGIRPDERRLRLWLGCISKKDTHGHGIRTAQGGESEGHAALNNPDQIFPILKVRDRLSSQLGSGGLVEDLDCFAPPEPVPIEKVKRDSMRQVIREV